MKLWLLLDRSAEVGSRREAVGSLSCDVESQAGAVGSGETKALPGRCPWGLSLPYAVRLGCVAGLGDWILPMLSLCGLGQLAHT